MIQVKSSGVSLSYSDLETKELNEILAELQTKFNPNAETIKGLFLDSLRMGLNALNSSDSPVNSEESENEIKELKEIRMDLVHRNLELTSKNTELVQGLEDRLDEISALNGKITELSNNLEVEVVEVVKEWQQTENDIFLQCTPIQVQALNLIAKNRLATNREKEVLTISEMARKLLFNKGTLFNYGGEMWTGLKRSEGKEAVR